MLFHEEGFAVINQIGNDLERKAESSNMGLQAHLGLIPDQVEPVPAKQRS